jgi:hypothetical protein
MVRLSTRRKRWVNHAFQQPFFNIIKNTGAVADNFYTTIKQSFRAGLQAHSSNGVVSFVESKRIF